MKKSNKNSKSTGQGFYKKSASFLLGEAILFGLIALAVFIRPLGILTSLAFIFGMGLTFFGLYQTIKAISDKKHSGRNISIAFGVINLIIGLIFFIAPAGAMLTVVYAFAILFFVKAIKSLIISIKLYKYKVRDYMFDLIMSIVMLVLASLILFFPKFGIVTFMYYVGIMLVLSAISDIRMYKKVTTQK